MYVGSGASFELAGGTIYACGIRDGAISAYGGGIYCVGDSVTMSGGVIRNCAVSADYGASGGAIFAKAGSVTMSGGVISGCSANTGGGVALIDFAELELGENARITGCTATEKNNTKAGNVEYGAAIYMDLDSLYL